MTPSAIRRLALTPSVMMTASVLLVAAGGYLFLALAGRIHDHGQAAAMASMYVLVNTIGQGVFAGLEQETSRSMSHALAVGDDPAPVVRRAVRHTLALLAVCCLFVAAVSPLLVSGPLHKQWPLIPTVLIGTVSYALSYLVRGLLGGMQLFGGYSATLVAEGLSRIVPCLVIAVAGIGSAFLFCLIYSCGLFFSAGVGWAFWLRTRLSPSAGQVEPADGPVPGLRGWFSAGLLLLVSAALLGQLVANLPALGASSRLADAPQTATAFVQAATLARIPLLLVGPVTALLLPRLTSAGAVGDLHTVRRMARTGTAAMLVLGSTAGAGLAVLGPWVLKTFFNATGISATALVLMAVGTAALMAAVGVLQPTLVGLQRQRLVPIAWAVGAAAMGVAIVWPGDPVAAAVAASLVGPAGVALAMAAGLRNLRFGSIPGEADDTTLPDAVASALAE